MAINIIQVRNPNLPTGSGVTLYTTPTGKRAKVLIINMFASGGESDYVALSINRAADVIQDSFRNIIFKKNTFVSQGISSSTGIPNHSIINGVYYGPTGAMTQAPVFYLSASDYINAIATRQDCHIELQIIEEDI